MYYDDRDYHRRNSRNGMSSRARKRRMRRRIKIAIGIIKLCMMLAVVVGLLLLVRNSDVFLNRNQKKVQKDAGNVSKEDENHTSDIPVSEVSNTGDNKLNEILANSEKYPEELLELLTKNPETLDFVYDYPDNHNKVFNIDISQDINTGKVPLFIQWDERWGYSSYGDSMIAVNGCGPTCLSMVAAYILHDEKMNPKWMAKFSETNGYISESGTSWLLMSEGAKELGLESIEIPLDENRILNNLMAGNLIICSMGPGVFTTEGHFIVMTGIKNGKIVVNDPNSRERSEKLWDYDEIKSQIKNLWVFR